MDKRKEELERKRQKLAELRKAREERTQVLTSSGSGSNGGGSLESPLEKTLSSRRSLSVLSAASSSSASLSGMGIGSGIGEKRHEIDDLVTSLIGNNPTSTSTTTSTATSPIVPVVQSASTPISSAPPTSIPPLFDQPQAFSTSLQSPTFADTTHQQQIKPNLSLAPTEFVLFDVPPKEKVMYSKEVQTIGTYTGDLDTDVDMEENNKENAKPVEQKSAPSTVMEKQVMEVVEEEEVVEEKPVPELSESQRQAILESESFHQFMESSTKYVERILSEPYDFMRDYAIVSDLDHDGSGSGSGRGKRMKYMMEFADDKLTQGRCVSDVKWSPKFPELLLASYGKNPTSPDPSDDGLVLVWNMHLQTRPEYRFHTQSDVLCADFSPFHPNILVGGTYSGQIVLWDLRAANQNNGLPVLKTPLSATQGHAHPIYAFQFIGTANAHQLVSISTDGTLCAWQLDMLSQPLEYLELSHPTHSKTDEIAVTCLGFPDNEVNKFWVGTEEGVLYGGNRYDRGGHKAGILSSMANETYVGHNGMITSMSFHPNSSSGGMEFGDLVLTSSIDWTVKLWRVGRGSGTSNTSSNNANIAHNTSQPLYSFENFDDAVYDVAWHPTQASCFVTGDGTGCLKYWDMGLDDRQVPVCSLLPNNDNGDVSHAISKLDWEKNEGGKRLVVGDSAGVVRVVDMSEVSTGNGSGGGVEDIGRFQRGLLELEGM